MLAKNFAPNFPVELVRNDIGVALQEAVGIGIESPMVGAVDSVLDVAATAGWNDRKVLFSQKFWTVLYVVLLLTHIFHNKRSADG